MVSRRTEERLHVFGCILDIDINQQLKEYPVQTFVVDWHYWNS